MTAGLDRADTVAVVGVGTMGAGIARVAAQAGHPVILLDAAPGRARAAVEGLRAELTALADRGRIDRGEAEAAAARLSPAADLADLAPSRLVIEAAAESIEIKRELFGGLEKVLGADCILATNTSSLSVSAIAAPLRHPERVAGMHFFNPAPVMRLVEVVSGLDTAPEVAARVAATARAWGKTPIQVTSTPGFVVNRVARPFYGEAWRALEELVTDAATIDAVARGAGLFRMGPLELTDLIGQDINYAANRSVWQAFGHDPRYTPSLAQGELVAAGRLGRKSGRGVYPYPDGRPAATPDPITSPPSPAPAHVLVLGDWGPWEHLWARVAQAGVRVERAEAGGPPRARTDRVTLAPTDGRSATAVSAAEGAPVVVLDLARPGASRLAVAVSDGCPAASVEEAVGLLQASGAAVSVLDDAPGLVLARTVAMLVNEAADVAGRGVASAADVDAAMQLGANYPVGPLTWGDELGATRVAGLLDTLAAHYGDGRYRPCPALRRAALTGRPLRG